MSYQKLVSDTGACQLNLKLEFSRTAGIRMAVGVGTMTGRVTFELAAMAVVALTGVACAKMRDPRALAVTCSDAEEAAGMGVHTTGSPLHMIHVHVTGDRVFTLPDSTPPSTADPLIIAWRGAITVAALAIEHCIVSAISVAAMPAQRSAGCGARRVEVVRKVCVKCVSSMK